MRAAVRWIARNPRGRIDQLSEWLGISGRQLQRRFAAAVGYGPKQFQSVLRFQRLLGLASHTPVPRTLGQLSAAAGYADQAHMTREFQRFAGGVPSQMLRAADSALALSDLLERGARRPLSRAASTWRSDRTIVAESRSANQFVRRTVSGSVRLARSAGRSVPQSAAPMITHATAM